MIKYDTIVWNVAIPKKLYNKVNYYLKSHGLSRDYFFNCGVDILDRTFRNRIDFPDPTKLYRFGGAEEADLVAWQFSPSSDEEKWYLDFIDEFGYDGRDVLAAALYEALEWKEPYDED